MFEVDMGAMAKDILSTIKETPWNKEIIDSWREVAVGANYGQLYEGIYDEL